MKYEADVMADYIWLMRGHGNSSHSFTHTNQFGFS